MAIPLKQEQPKMVQIAMPSGHYLYKPILIKILIQSNNNQRLLRGSCRAMFRITYMQSPLIKNSDK